MRKAILLLLSAVIITLMIPHRGNLDLGIQLGETWSESTLIAPFDIPISKNSATIEAERNKVIADFKPVFRENSALTRTKLHEVKTSLSRRDLLSPETKDTVNKAVQQIYARGIIPETEQRAYQGRIVRVLRGNDLESYPITEIFTPSSALEYAETKGVKSPIIASFITPNLSYDEQLNTQLRNQELAQISTTNGMIRTGEIVIARGQVLDLESEPILRSFKDEYDQRLGTTIGMEWKLVSSRWLIVSLILLLNYLFFMQFASNYFGNNLREWTFLLMLYTLMATLMALAAHIPSVSPYTVPLVIVPIYLMTFFNMRVAIFGNISVVWICSLFVRVPFDFLSINLLAGFVSIFMVQHLYRRNDVLRAMGAILLTQVVGYICFSLLREGNFLQINYTNLVWFLVSAVLTLGLYQAVYLLEKLFGFVSDISLLELCDTNQPLLMELAQKAPGTFQHSVQVANLAEGAAKEIGANPLLVRTGAMYHDIGKMQNPFYFTENQSGDFNPHHDITPRESSLIIRCHVTDGVTIAQKAGIPKQIINFITSHHGDYRLFYFWAAQKALTEVIENEQDFSYPGPRPVSREVSICMMADAVEAASRSLKSYDKEPLAELVNKIIDTQIAEGQLQDSELSFAEIGKIKELFIQKLNTIYHTRITYPERSTVHKSSESINPTAQ